MATSIYIHFQVVMASKMNPFRSVHIDRLVRIRLSQLHKFINKNMTLIFDQICQQRSMSILQFLFDAVSIQDLELLQVDVKLTFLHMDLADQIGFLSMIEVLIINIAFLESLQNDGLVHIQLRKLKAMQPIFQRSQMELDALLVAGKRIKIFKRREAPNLEIKVVDDVASNIEVEKE